ncbi:arylamine N-acetyltransferase [Lottiidibacillus patelloidae]|uniref:Arylamine N-acetyltransferase n=1 Tax=Lottiidibacillus patelloidae TaxID=2670334 RepID=A0A263BWA9_9BACI|nr:arylamine N-acetyltransferase [Lottiidibacillus patelloidae]OZM58023.1 arylamine N-acetyltransferase [Lottiidibacillus patelloidae]
MNINSLFRKRIGISENEEITFEKLAYILVKTSQTIPFENLVVIDNREIEISNEYLVNKVLVNNEGGLCYEINPLLYLFLRENGFHVNLLSGNVYDKENEQFQPIGDTHVTILLSHQNKSYIIDSGFGGNLPLKPVPLSGETVKSMNGEFKIKGLDRQAGRYLFEMKIKDKYTDWKVGYAFNVDTPIESMDELNKIKDIIFEHEQSPFNKHPLVSYFTERGRTVLTNTYFRSWENGVMKNEEIDDERFAKLVCRIFRI